MRSLARRGLAITGVLAALAGASCKSTSGPPSSFGVNVTVDAGALSSADRARVVNGILRVTGAETAVKKLDVHSAISSGQLRFHYIPSVTSGSIGIAFDALDASDAVVATGAAPANVTLAANAAVAVTVKLAMGSGKKGDSAACTAASDCDSGFCVDGVCCNEKCDEACASCAMTDHRGACTPYPADTDPEMECGPEVAPISSGGGDAGAADGGSPGDGGSPDAGDAGGATDGASGGGSSDGPVINAPDGGIVSMPGACGGTCSGTRACKFPGTEKTCGTPFCNTNEEIAAFVCNGNGGCTVGLTKCADYACDPGNASCRTRCSQTTDCGAADYCNANGMCLPKKGISIQCSLGTECQSGFCASGVCCETACDQPGFTCSDTSSVGKCKCPGLTCTMGCRLFYPDQDADGFGDKFAVLASPPVAGSARTGCVESPPSGFVADNTDCDDGDANAKPGQTAFFGASSLVKHIFDYDCDGVQEKETPEYPFGSCKFCGAVGSCSSTTSACASASAQSAFQCPQELALLRFAAPPATSVSVVPPPILILPQCCGCYSNDQHGFTQTVNCGSSGTVTTCGTCAVAGGAPANSTTFAVQRCH